MQPRNETFFPDFSCCLQRHIGLAADVIHEPDPNFSVERFTDVLGVLWSQLDYHDRSGVPRPESPLCGAGRSDLAELLHNLAHAGNRGQR